MSITDLYVTLRQQHQWDRKKAMLAARYYLGVETITELRSRAEPQPVHREYVAAPELTAEDVAEIVRWR